MSIYYWIVKTIFDLPARFLPQNDHFETWLSFFVSSSVVFVIVLKGQNFAIPLHTIYPLRTQADPLKIITMIV